MICMVNYNILLYILLKKKLLTVDHGIFDVEIDLVFSFDVIIN